MGGRECKLRLTVAIKPLLDGPLHGTSSYVKLKWGHRSLLCGRNDITQVSFCLARSSARACCGCSESARVR